MFLSNSQTFFKEIVYPGIPAGKSCFHDYGQELALSLLYAYFIILKKKDKIIKSYERKAYELKQDWRDKITAIKKDSKFYQNGNFDILTACHERWGFQNLPFWEIRLFFRLMRIENIILTKNR